MVLSFLAICFFVMPTPWSTHEVHEFHLSKCDIHYNHDEAALQIALSLFIDDLEMTLATEGKTDLRICSKNESPLAEEAILQYIRDHLHISVDGHPTELRWVGKEVSEDLAAVWSYLEVVDASPQKYITVENDLLMDTFDDQQNIVKLVMDQNRQSFFLFNKKEFSGRLDL